MRDVGVVILGGSLATSGRFGRLVTCIVQKGVGIPVIAIDEPLVAPLVGMAHLKAAEKGV
jgi:hypothetical protein